MVTIANKNFINGSIKRKNYQNYNKRFLYRYRDVVADLVNNNAYVYDGLYSEMNSQGIISDEAYAKYNESLLDLFTTLSEQDDETDESWYLKILKLRELFVDERVSYYINHLNQNYLLKTDFGINDYSDLLLEIKNRESFIILIDDCKYIEYIDEIVSAFDANNQVTIMLHKNKYVDASLNTGELNYRYSGYKILYSDHEGVGFDLKNIKVTDTTLVIGFGEWCLGAFKNLNVDSYVISESKEIITRVLTSSTIKSEIHCVFIPRSYDVFGYISVVERSRMNYRTIAQLKKKIGNDVYRYSYDQLLKKWPEYFINIESDKKISFNGDFPSVSCEDSLSKVLTSKILADAEGIELGCDVTFNSEKQPMKYCYLSLEQRHQSKISIRSFETSQELRALYRSSNVKKGYLSNFLFFATDKMLSNYNTIRANRIPEQFSEAGWHLDYLKEVSETFPLYNKAMIGLNLDKEIIFRHQMLQGGQIEIEGKISSWTENQVDSSQLYDLNIYTPYGYSNSTNDYHADCKLVGHNRINMIIIHKSIVVVRDGDVVLPNIGVVLSFDKSYFNSSFGDVMFDSNGYNYDFKTYKLKLDNTGDLLWAYGGGMFLVDNYKAFDNEDKIMASFRNEGWLHNLSKQTQDSPTYQLDRHPRTGIGLTHDGHFFILTIAGRSIKSVGADYFDMINVAKQIFGSVKYLMNVDGGASSVLAAIMDSEVIALNDITYTNDSGAGSLRPLNAMIEISL